MDMSYTFATAFPSWCPGKTGQTYTLAYPPEPQEGDKNNYALELEPHAVRARAQRGRCARTIIEMAQSSKGMTRNIGMHAGGVLIAPGKLTDFFARCTSSRAASRP